MSLLISFHCMVSQSETGKKFLSPLVYLRVSPGEMEDEEVFCYLPLRRDCARDQIAERVVVGGGDHPHTYQKTAPVCDL